MRVFLVTAAIVFAAAGCGYSQDLKHVSGTAETHAITEKAEPPTLEASTAAAEKPTESDPTASAEPPNENSKKASRKAVRARLPVPYVRPEAGTRFKNYLDGTFGPESWIRYAATAGLLTLRNTPKEWGTKPEGFGRRIFNVTAKNVIRTTTIYGLDEALKLDSAFYLSRDRGVAARLRNSVFSAVTARNRRGHRVIGIPRLAGSFTSEVISSTVWYPSRYDQDHGFKGGAISIGISAGVNLFREFVLKR